MMSMLENIRYKLLKTELEISENRIFLIVYRDENLKNIIIRELEKSFPSCEHILLPEDISSWIASETKPGNMTVWTDPDKEKQLFSIFPEWYLSKITVFDFSGVSQEIRREKQGPLIGSTELPLSVIEKFSKYLEKSLPQYENLYYIPLYFTNRKDRTFLLDDLARAFLSDKANTNLMIIMGEKNAGKTSFFLHYFSDLSKQFLKDPHKKRFPVLISLNRNSDKTEIENIILTELYQSCGIEFPSDHFKELYRKGKFVFIIDGFDDISKGMTTDQTSDLLRQIYRLSCESDSAGKHSLNKVMMSCFPHHIYKRIQNGKVVYSEEHTVLYKEYAPQRNVEAVCINSKSLDGDDELKAYLLKAANDGIAVRNILSILSNAEVLSEYSEPCLLKQMIIQTAPAFRDKQEINIADIYRAYTDIWICLEDWRCRLSPEEKKILLSELSMTMFQKRVSTVQSAYQEDMKFCQFLSCDDKGNYAFIHPSFPGYFLARAYFDRIKNKADRLFPADKMDKITVFFLKMIVSSEKADLAGLDLSGLNLENINLYRANLSGSNLNKSNLKFAELMGAVLSGSDLTGANLSKASLVRANFHNADMTGTDMTRARLRDAQLGTAHLNGANFHGADLTGAKLSGAKLTFTGMSEADLSRADLSNAVLNNADLSGAKLCQANLNKADLTGANLSEADLTDADLVEAVLSEADLRDAKLVMANMTWAKLNEADMSNANLNRSRLREADLTEANFNKASLNQADLRWAKIDRAGFRDAKLREAHFTGASIVEAIFNSADLAWANFTNAILTSSDFSGANLNMAKFREANLIHCKFVGADLTWADLTKADLSRADLSSAILVEADLREADLRDSKMSRANLSGANMKQAKLEGADMNGTDLDENTD